TQFNLAARLISTTNGRRSVVVSETFRNLMLDKTSPRYAVEVVKDGSDLVRLQDMGLGDLPQATGVDVIGTVSDPTPSTAFLALGVSPGTAGGDGVQPGSNTWANTAGAAALLGTPSAKTGMYALARIAPFVFNLLCIPATASLSDASARSVWTDAAKFCRDKRAFLLVDIPTSVNTHTQMGTWIDTNATLRTDSAAVYFP